MGSSDFLDYYCEILGVAFPRAGIDGYNSSQSTS